MRQIQRITFYWIIVNERWSGFSEWNYTISLSMREVSNAPNPVNNVSLNHCQWEMIRGAALTVSLSITKGFTVSLIHTRTLSEPITWHKEISLFWSCGSWYFPAWDGRGDTTDVFCLTGDVELQTIPGYGSVAGIMRSASETVIVHLQLPSLPLSHPTARCLWISIVTVGDKKMTTTPETGEGKWWVVGEKLSLLLALFPPDPNLPEVILGLVVLRKVASMSVFLATFAVSLRKILSLYVSGRYQAGIMVPSFAGFGLF